MYFLSKYNAIIDRNTKLARNTTELPPKTKAYTNVAIEGVRLMSKRQEDIQKRDLKGRGS